MLTMGDGSGGILLREFSLPASALSQAPCWALELQDKCDPSVTAFRLSSCPSTREKTAPRATCW